MRFATLGLGLAGLVSAAPAHASGFALVEQNASGLGNAYAGQAAVAEDASTVYFNPAGLSRIAGRQAVLAGHAIVPSARFSGTASTVGLPAQPVGQGGDAGLAAFVPNAYLALDLAPGLKFGIGLNAPFGLATKYEAPWAGQAQALRSELKSYNVNPSLAWRIDDRLSLGVGVNWQRVEAELSSIHPVTGLPVVMRGDDASWGWNAGGLWAPDDATRIGLAYRGGIEHKLTGTLAPAGVAVTAALSLPDSVSLSLFRRLTPSWDLLADVTRTGWDSFDELRVVPAGGGAPLSLVTDDWKATWRVALGLTWHAGERMNWRFGLAHDQTPVRDATHRTPRIPDSDRTWLALGGQYRLSPRSALDYGYAHLFFADAPIAHCEPETSCPAPGVTLNGSYRGHVDILSLQFTHNF